MEHTQQLVALLGAGAAAMAAIAAIVHRQRGPRHRTAESPFAMSTEGDTRCPNCGMGNLWSERSCISCGRRLGS